jgi:hypothetical protein
MNKTNKVPDFNKMTKELITNTSRYAGSESVKFFKESFVKQGFTDKSLNAWKKTTNPLAGKRTLYSKGVLMQSIRKVDENSKRIVVESDTDYSEIQNNGGEITVTENMKRFFWARYYEFSGKTRTTTRGNMSRSKNNLKTNAKAEFCKRMALMKVGSKIKIPKRQFMGHSDTMMKQFSDWFAGQIDVQFKQHLND